MPLTARFLADPPASGARFGRLAAAIAIGAFLAGSLDIFVASAINHVGPGVILQAIASGLLGRAAFESGANTMAAGLLLQWVMSLIIATIYGLASLKLPDLYRRPAIFGALYGVPVYVVMTFIVLPLSAAHPRHPPAAHAIALNLAAMILFGLILAFAGWAIGPRAAGQTKRRRVAKRATPGQ